MAITSIGSGAFVNGKGDLTENARMLLQQLRKPLAAAEVLSKLDAGTTYTADQLRDKLNQILTALGAQS